MDGVVCGSVLALSGTGGRVFIASLFPDSDQWGDYFDLPWDIGLYGDFGAGFVAIDLSGRLSVAAFRSGFGFAGAAGSGDAADDFGLLGMVGEYFFAGLPVSIGDQRYYRNAIELPFVHLRVGIGDANRTGDSGGLSGNPA